jgi:hypothetical protein
MKASPWDQFVVFWAAQIMTPYGFHFFVRERGLHINERLELVRHE